MKIIGHAVLKFILHNPVLQLFVPLGSRPMKLEFPGFWGKNPIARVYKANQYFKYYNVSPNEQLVLASFHMDGEALVWYQDCEESGIFDR